MFSFLFLCFALSVQLNQFVVFSLPAVPSLRVSACGSVKNGGGASFGNFKVTNTNATNIQAANQSTDGEICWSNDGIHIEEVATDRYIFSPYTVCDSPVFVNSDVLEVFMAPVKSIHDNPTWYYELDLSPSGVLWAGLSNNSLGNTSYCPTSSGCSKSGPLPCTGKSNFPSYGFQGKAANFSTSSWGTKLFVPWTAFSEEFQMKGGKPWEMFRMNFYRYDYPNGPASGYELSGWSPTFSGSFHVPERFGIIYLV